MLNLNWSVFVITLLTKWQNNKQFVLSPNGKLYELNEHSSCNWSKSVWNQNVHCKKLMSNRKQKGYTTIQDNAFNAKVANVVQCELWFENSRSSMSWLCNTYRWIYENAIALFAWGSVINAINHSFFSLSSELGSLVELVWLPSTYGYFS